MTLPHATTFSIYVFVLQKAVHAVKELCEKVLTIVYCDNRNALEGSSCGTLLESLSLAVALAQVFVCASSSTNFDSPMVLDVMLDDC